MAHAILVTHVPSSLATLILAFTGFCGHLFRSWVVPWPPDKTFIDFMMVLGDQLITLSPQRDMRLWNLNTGQLEHLHRFSEKAPESALKIDATTILCCAWDLCFEWNILTWQMTSKPQEICGSWLSGTGDQSLAKEHFAAYGSAHSGTCIYERRPNQTYRCITTLPTFSRPVGWTDDGKLWVSKGLSVVDSRLASYDTAGNMLCSLRWPSPSDSFYGNISGSHLAVMDDCASEFFILEKEIWSKVTVDQPYNFPVSSMRILFNGQAIVRTKAGNWKLYDGQDNFDLGQLEWLSAQLVLRDGRYITAEGETHRITIWE